MTVEPRTSKWIDLKANSALRELAESHYAALLRNISKRKANKNGSPKQSKDKVKKNRPLSSSPTVSAPERKLDPEPATSLSSPKKVVVRGNVDGHRRAATYTFNRDKLPVLLARAKEFVKKWHEPTPPKNSIEAVKKSLRNVCNVFTINHSKAVCCVKPTNPVYISMEFRKCFIRHDWAGVKKLLKVLLRCPFKEDRVTWRMVLATLYYYPGAEPVLRKFIERNRNMFVGSEILRGLLEINGMEPYTYRKSEESWREDSLLAPMVANGDGKNNKQKSKKKNNVEVVVADVSEGSE